jgi:hypothetical protein
MWHAAIFALNSFFNFFWVCINTSELQLSQTIKITFGFIFSASAFLVDILLNIDKSISFSSKSIFFAMFILSPLCSIFA